MTADARIVVSFLALLSTKLVGRGIRFVYLLVIARFLPEEELGIFVYGLALSLLVMPLALFGQQVYLPARVSAAGDRAPRILEQSFSLVVAASTLVGLASTGFILITEQETSYRVALVVLMTVVWCRATVIWVRNVFVAYEETSWILRYQIVFRGGEAIAGTTVLLLGGGLIELCVLHFFGWGIESVLSLVRLRRRRASLAPRRLVLRQTRELLRPAAPVAVIAVLIAAAIHLEVTVLRGLESDAAAIAQFGIAMQVLTVWAFIPNSLAQAVLPQIARGHRDGVDMSPLLAALGKAQFLSGMAAAVALAATGEALLVALFGPRYAEAGRILAEMAWALGPFALVLFLAKVFNALDGTRLALILMVLFVATKLVVIGAGDARPIIIVSQSVLVSAWGGALAGLILMKLRARRDPIGRWIALWGALALLVALGHASWLSGAQTIGARVAVLALAAALCFTRRERHEIRRRLRR